MKQGAPASWAILAKVHSISVRTFQRGLRSRTSARRLRGPSSSLRLAWTSPTAAAATTAFPSLLWLARDGGLRWSLDWCRWWFGRRRRRHGCGDRGLRPSNGTRELSLCGQLELVQTLFDIRVKDTASRGICDQWDPDIRFDGQGEFRITIYGFQHIRTSKCLQPAASLPKLHTMRRLEDCLLDGLHRDACEVPVILDGHSVRAPLKQIGCQPEPCDTGVSFQTADQLEDPLHRCPNDAVPFDANHVGRVRGMAADEALVRSNS